MKSNHKESGTSVKITSGVGVAPLDSCVTHSRVTHRYLKDKTTEKREKKETVLQSNINTKMTAMHMSGEINTYFVFV